MRAFDRDRGEEFEDEDELYQEYEEKFGGDSFEKFSRKKGPGKQQKGKKPRDNFSREMSF